MLTLDILRWHNACLCISGVVSVKFVNRHTKVGRFVYRKLLGGLGGSCPVPFGSPHIGVFVRWILDFEFENLSTLVLGNCNFQAFVVQLAALQCLFRFHFSLFTCPERCHLFQEIFLGSAVTRSCLISKLRFLLYSCDSKFVFYSCHVHADHFNYMVPRSLGSQSFCYPPSASLVSLSGFFATSFGSLRTFTYGGIILRGFSFDVCTFTCIWFDWCVVSDSKFHVASIQPSTKSAVLSRRVVFVVLWFLCVDFSGDWTFIGVLRWHTACLY